MGSQNEAEKAMRPASPRHNLVKIFNGALYQFSTVRKTSVTDDVTDWSLRTKFLAALLGTSIRTE